jgi:hypothetical protein
MEPRKQAIIRALQRFIRQRPGMDPRDYDYAGTTVAAQFLQKVGKTTMKPRS